VALARLKADVEQIEHNLGAGALVAILNVVSAQISRLGDDWSGVHLADCCAGCELSHMPRDERVLLASLEAKRETLAQELAQTIGTSALSADARELLELARNEPEALYDWRAGDAEREAYVAEAVIALYKHATIERRGTAKRWCSFHIAEFELRELRL